LDWLDPRKRQREGIVVNCCKVNSNSIIWANQDEQSSELESSLPSYENVGDCGTEGRKGGGKERKKEKEKKSGKESCYFDASPFFLRNTQNIGISDYI
jgi:hypothetical protein